MTNKSINQETKIIQNQRIVSSELDGEIVMMSVEKGRYYRFDSVGSTIWSMIKNEIQVVDVVKNLIEIYDVNQDKCLQEVVEFLDKLQKDELVYVL
jgi:hypothetical protein